ncbi:myeloid differentiation primary response protein MyD88 isoform X2 [Musca autumnalis]|uniref:myeloid differentiation primary response protein MyD88 isoform X2 n=1 Tax=Musca autumnalis TaxID=221902 RepID=UPI003CF44EA0
MVMDLTLSISNIHRSNMSINSGSAESPFSPIECDAISFQGVPLSELSKSSRKKLSRLLNSKKILRSEEGYERDWRGLAVLTKQKSLCDENGISGDDPMSKVIQLWCKNSPNTATFAHLETYLGIIDRWDVCDDIYEDLVQDTKVYQSKIQQNEHFADIDNYVDNNDDFGHGSDPNILTTDDVMCAKQGKPPQRYDAFVLYADADLPYVTEMLTKLEDNSEYKFKLCVKDRLLAGVAFQHIALTKLIVERCSYLIVLLTNAFLKSAENKFLVDFTQALQIEQRTRRIIPLLYENIEIPRTLNIYTHLRYSTSGFCDYWAKLANSIRNVNMVSENTVKTPVSRKDVESTPLTSNRPVLTGPQEVRRLPSPPTVIPSISINGEVTLNADSNLSAKKQERPKSRAFTLRHKKSTNLLNESSKLRNAHSTGQLHTTYDHNNTASMSNISTSSEKKKKGKMKKILKVFSFSNSKLSQQTT